MKCIFIAAVVFIQFCANSQSVVTGSILNTLDTKSTGHLYLKDSFRLDSIKSFKHRISMGSNSDLDGMIIWGRVDTTRALIVLVDTSRLAGSYNHMMELIRRKNQPKDNSLWYNVAAFYWDSQSSIVCFGYVVREWYEVTIQDNDYDSDYSATSVYRPKKIKIHQPPIEYLDWNKNPTPNKYFIIDYKTIE